MCIVYLNITVSAVTAGVSLQFSVSALASLRWPACFRFSEVFVMNLEVCQNVIYGNPSKPGFKACSSREELYLAMPRNTPKWRPLETFAFPGAPPKKKKV